LILKRGYAYVSGGNVYFSVDRFPSYGELANLNLEKQRAGARIDVDPNKRNPFDFVLWFTESKFPDQEMKWDSPWGVGFPGWHIECSAMATKYLGEFIDIHCGGVDHVPVHHTNEIAQSEAALGHRWVNYWLHGEFLVLKSGKMSKSKGKFVTLSALKEQGYAPNEYRYLCLGTHYRMNLDFGLTAMQGAQNALENLKASYLAWLDEPAAPWTDLAESYREEFSAGIADDLNTPRSLAAMWKMARDPELPGALKRDLLIEFDNVLALGVSGWQREELPEALLKLITLREEARKAGRFSDSDQLRDQLLEAGVAVKDTPAGTKWYRTRPPRTPKE
jgi:cysteinyl-tRNA synthetase